MLVISNEQIFVNRSFELILSSVLLAEEFIIETPTIESSNISQIFGWDAQESQEKWGIVNEAC